MAKSLGELLGSAFEAILISLATCYWAVVLVQRWNLPNMAVLIGMALVAAHFWWKTVRAYRARVSDSATNSEPHESE
jgi:hypothetical protein